MAVRVEWSLEARDDLQRIAEFIRRDSRAYARAVVRRILDSIRKLEQFARMGRVVPELGDEAFRELLIYSHRVIDRIEGDVVTIAAIVHGKQSLDLGNDPS
jgi:plasmid stabilization system protein ParE